MTNSFIGLLNSIFLHLLLFSILITDFSIFAPQQDRIKTIPVEFVNLPIDIENIPKKISFLRMDTDIYKTTVKQLEVLYPKLSPGGILHIDDYGLCTGVRKAVDDYFKGQNIWLHRVDLRCRYLIKSK